MHIFLSSAKAKGSPTDACPPAPIPSKSCTPGICCSCMSVPAATKVSGVWSAARQTLSVKLVTSLPAGTRVRLSLAKSKGFR